MVAAGETLGGIANRAGVAASAIAKANGLKEPYVVRLGQKLKIPRPAPVPQAAAERSANAAARTAARVNDARAASPETETSHKVLDGETLSGIAARAKVPRVLIIEANGLQAPFNVRVGQTLRIPRTRHHLVKPGETGFAIALDYAVPWEQIALANNLDPAMPVKAGRKLLIPTLLNPPATSAIPTAAPVTPVTAAPAPTRSARFAWPVSGPIRRGYVAGGGDYHDGIDITAPRDTMVRAAAAGIVTFAGEEKEQFGNLVVLDHGDGWFTAYGFLSRVTVRKGAKVTAGERVGLVGSTGLAKGSELHFEVRRNGKPIDPQAELPPRSSQAS